MKKRGITVLLLTLSLILGLVPLALAEDAVEVTWNESNGKYGAVDKAGNEILPPIYDWLDMCKGYFLAEKDGKAGVLDRTGRAVIPLEYDYCYTASADDSYSICEVRKNGKMGLLTYPEGKELAPLIYDELNTTINGLADVRIGGHWGVLDWRTGKLVAPVEFDSVDTWVNGLDELAAVEKDGLYGAYDRDGNEVYPCRFPSIAQLRGAVQSGNPDPAGVGEASREAGLDVTWYPEWQTLTRLYGTDRMILVKNDLCALYGLDGTKYTEPVFDAIGEYDAQGQAAAMRNGKWGKIDLDGNTVVDFLYDTQGEAKDDVGVKFVSKYPGEPPYALARLDGKRLTGYDFWAYHPFVNGFAMVTDGGEGWRFIDTTGKAITEQKYSGLSLNSMKMGGSDFGEDGYAIVYGLQGGYNIINAQGRELLPEGSSVKPWRAGFGIWGYERGGFGFIELDTGRVVARPQFVNAFDTGKSWPAGYQFNEDGVMSVVLSEDGELRYYLMDTRGNQTAAERGENGLPVDPATGNAYNPSSGPSGASESRALHEGLEWVNAEGETWGFGLDFGIPWGFQDEAGKVVVPCIYDTVGHFDHGYASVTVNGVYGLLKNPLAQDGEAHRVSDWAAEEVAAATGAGYVTPRCSTYQTRTITRLQFAELAVNYLEKKTGKTMDPAPADTFTDTGDEAVLKACAAGIVQGVGEGRFAPDDPLDREQLATMLWRAMEKAGAGMHYGGMDRYEDWDQVSDWAATAMNNLVHHNVMTGTGENTLSPKASCTVEQAILLVYRAAGQEYTLLGEEKAWRQAALDRVTIEGLKIGTPLDQLPEQLRVTLKKVGEPYDSWAEFGLPGKDISQKYEAPGMEIITSRCTPQTLESALKGQDTEHLQEMFGSGDQETIYAQELDREYVTTVTLTDDTYRLVSGLKVGDSEERARELGYGIDNLNSETCYSLGSVNIIWENDVVIELRVSDMMGRRIGPFFDP